MTATLQQFLFYSDIAFILLCCFAAYKSYSNGNKSILTVSTLVILGAAVWHWLVSIYANYPKPDRIEVWYQTFEYINIAIILIAVAIHALLLWHTSKIVKSIYGLLTLNVCCYTFMHWQRNVFNIQVHNWTWDVYTWTVVSVNYIIAGLLIYASLKAGNNKSLWKPSKYHT